jgi:membrane associated rhomboid family serine protease
MAWEDRPYNRDEPPRLRVSVPMPGPMTMAVMGTCLLSFLLLNVFHVLPIYEYGELTFRGGRAFTQPWRWITYAYLHGSGGHIFWNLLGLYFFLPPLERVWGWRRAFAFYTIGTIVAGVTFGLLCLLFPFGGLIGASGGILAALGACAYLFPEMTFLGIIPIRVAAALFGILYLLTIAGDKDASNAAHLGGLVFGFFAPYYGSRFSSRFLEGFKRHRRQREIIAEQEESQTIDRILQKVHDHGMNSLTRGEKNALKRATDRQRRTEDARPSRRV